MDASKIPILPLEIVREILLKLPLNPKTLSKFKCVSKSWLELMSSPEFVKTHLKLTASDKYCNHHKVLFTDSENNFKVYSLPSLFYLDASNIEVFDLDSPVEDPPSLSWTVGNVNGLVCLFNRRSEGFLWNPTIRKSKKLPYFGFNLMQGCRRSYGFGYDKLHDDYKVAIIEYFTDKSNDVVVNVYSLRFDSWRRVDEFPSGCFPLNNSGKFVNGKLYWGSSTEVAPMCKVCNIVSLDITDETWGILELPSRGEDNGPWVIGVVGSDLALLASCILRPKSDVWTVKDCGGNVSWTKMVTLKYIPVVWVHMFPAPIYTFTMHFCPSNESEVLLFLRPIMMMCDSKAGSTRPLKVTGFGEGSDPEIYIESLVDPLLIADRGLHYHETSQSFR